jgi:hypothetical protein
MTYTDHTPTAMDYIEVPWSNDRTVLDECAAHYRDMTVRMTLLDLPAYAKRDAETVEQLHYVRDRAANRYFIGLSAAMAQGRGEA